MFLLVNIEILGILEGYKGKSFQIRHSKLHYIVPPYSKAGLLHKPAIKKPQ